MRTLPRARNQRLREARKDAAGRACGRRFCDTGLDRRFEAAVRTCGPLTWIWTADRRLHRLGRQNAACAVRPRRHRAAYCGSPSFHPIHHAACADRRSLFGCCLAARFLGALQGHASPQPLLGLPHSVPADRRTCLLPPRREYAAVPQKCPDQHRRTGYSSLRDNRRIERHGVLSASGPRKQKRRKPHTGSRSAPWPDAHRRSDHLTRQCRDVRSSAPRTYWRLRRCQRCRAQTARELLALRYLYGDCDCCGPVRTDPVVDDSSYSASN